jgi:DNA (cytosine-5)-methyltransferase 1
VRALSLFSGCGGLDLALERAGITVVAQCEQDEWRRSVLAARFPGVPCAADVREAPACWGGRSLPGVLGPELDGADGGRGGARAANGDAGVDLVVGGPPCQDFSVAGRRAGLAGLRGTLFHEFLRVADELLPAGGWLLAENVPGLLSSHGGRDFAAILGAMADLGFRDLAYRTLDSRFFGVPQRRRRVFILARRARGRRACEVLLEPEGGGGDPAPRPEARAGIAGSVADGARSARTLTARTALRFDGDTEGFVVSALQAEGNGRGHRIDAEGAAGGHLVPVGFHMTQDPIHSNGGTPALGRTSIGMDVITSGVRRLTPIETERLQGFPDDWTRVPDDAPDSRRYAAVGDAVTVPVARWIGERLLRFG